MVSLKLAILSSSKFVVGSSKAKTPHFELKASANAIRMINDAKTYLREMSSNFKVRNYKK
jgi:hypothetical protein